MSRAMRSPKCSAESRSLTTLLSVVQLLSDAPFMVSFSDMETLLAAGQASAKVRLPLRSSILCPYMLESSFPAGTYTERNKGLIVNCGEMEEMLSIVARDVSREKINWWCRRLSKGHVVVGDFGIKNSNGEKLVAVVPFKTTQSVLKKQLHGNKLVFHALGSQRTQNTRLSLRTKEQEGELPVTSSGIVALLDHAFTLDSRLNRSENLPCSGLTIIAPVLDYAMSSMMKHPDPSRTVRLENSELHWRVRDAQIWPLEMLKLSENRQFVCDLEKTEKELITNQLRDKRKRQSLSRCPKLRDHISIAGWDAESYRADALNLHRFASACLRWVVPNSSLQSALVEALNECWDDPNKATDLFHHIIFSE
ncbi:hypothetical protein GNI_063880 [Gregarina niphandrodes]|uniref:Uncharacterized protein n=1 Tax=Gregarina niphandrodes TaxID=110365 RepID=A0A023B861_GRENI|nr:hypothetical protein GNI_063880 [Gregarina niphandrodes]EZG68168.1 hypothetical protein GNI_063880 [Gregarina niphandrodes]|eukprot:XP_011130062.1 hypothetical protein GNI_063880 [Gregarina niphandrodes]